MTKKALKIHHFKGSRKFRQRAAVKLFPGLEITIEKEEVGDRGVSKKAAQLAINLEGLTVEGKRTGDKGI